LKAKEKLFDKENGDLNDCAIIDLIETALQDYKNGAILECRKNLRAVERAITNFEKNYF
jgi:hypothetical protein